jgi:arylsulfatase A-like enzyme
MNMHVSRRTFLMSSAAPLLAMKKAPGRSSIVLVLADELGAWMLGCYGNQEIRTPNINLLARGGTRFLHHCVCTPASPASRATLFTGRVPRQHGMEDMPEGESGTPASFRQEVMISDLLASSGYNCGYVGKWNMGDDAKPQRGFRFWYTMPAGAGPYQNPRMSWNGQIAQEQGYLPELMTRKAVAFLEEQKPGQPFFLVASYQNPRAPLDGHPQKYYDAYARAAFETAGWLPRAANAAEGKEYLGDTVGSLRKCAAAVTALDDQLPALIATLDKKGLRDETLVIFSAASGLLAGRHGLWSAGRASDPVNMYAEAIESPMIWNWPGRTPVEAMRPELISSYDLFPSLCEVAGVPVPVGRGLFGRSYVPLATNEPLPKKQPWRNLVFGHLGNTEMVEDTRCKLLLRNGGAGPNELYDLRKDPRERVNEYDNGEFITLRDAMAKELVQWRKKHA